MSFNVDQILLVGVGGGGSRIVNDVARATEGRMRTIAMDTDFNALGQCGHSQHVRVEGFSGNGTGGNMDGAHTAADAMQGELAQLLVGTSILVVVAGISGGTGAGVSGTLLALARKANIRTLLFAVHPFAHEGQNKQNLAKRAYPALENAADVSVIVRNDDLCADAIHLPYDEAMARATAILSPGMTLLWRMLGTPGYVQLDAATLVHILRYGKGRADFGYATAQGPQRFDAVISDLLDHPRRGIRAALPNAKAMVLGIIGGSDLLLKEVGDSVARLRMELDKNCDVRVGTVLDAREGSSLSLVVLAFRSWKPNDSPVMRPAFDENDLDVPTYLRRGLLIDSSVIPV